MITQWFMGFLHGLASTLSSWMLAAVPSPPGFISDMNAGLTTASGMVPSAVRYFVPITPMVAAGAAYFGIVLALGAVRAARRVLSLFTGGGGNA